MSFAALQAHVTGRALELPSTSKALLQQLKKQLLAASDSEALQDSPQHILQILRLLPEPPPQVMASLKPRALHQRAFCVIGGDKNQERDHDVAHFRRRDGAWFDFSITARDCGNHIELLAYDFELRFPLGEQVPFVRFDCNLPDHRNEARDLRCHLHPGTDDIIVPSPMMSPSELLALLIDGVQPVVDRAPRARTAFERDWFAHAHRGNEQ